MKAPVRDEIVPGLKLTPSWQRYFEYLNEKLFIQAYCEMDNTNTPTAISIATVNVWTEITTGFTGIIENGCLKFQNAHEITNTVADVFGIFYSVSFDSAANNKEFEVGIMVDGVIQTNGLTHSYMSVLSQTQTTGSQLIVDLPKNSLISMAIRNVTDNTDVTIEHANVIVIRLGRI